MGRLPVGQMMCKRQGVGVNGTLVPNRMVGELKKLRGVPNAF